MKCTIHIFYIFSHGVRKNLFLNIEYHSLFTIALSTWPSSKANYQVSSSSPGSNWIQLILVSHEWGILKETFFDTRKS